jgi:hypothetical protein
MANTSAGGTSDAGLKDEVRATITRGDGTVEVAHDDINPEGFVDPDNPAQNTMRLEQALDPVGERPKKNDEGAWREFAVQHGLDPQVAKGMSTKDLQAWHDGTPEDRELAMLFEEAERRHLRVEALRDMDVAQLREFMGLQG